MISNKDFAFLGTLKSARRPRYLHIGAAVALLSTAVISGCERPPIDYRDMVSLPEYTQGDADNGALIYDDACAQCHKIVPGNNKKGPQLMNIYGAPAAALDDYHYSDALAQSGWVWDAQTLDAYIKDVEVAMPESKMLADPMPDASERADVIAYLSTLRQAPPAPDEVLPDKSKPAAMSQMSNDAVEIEAGAAGKPAADFQ